MTENTKFPKESPINSNMNTTEAPILTATTYKMASEQVQLVFPQHIRLETQEVSGDTVPPPHIIAMNAAFNLKKCDQPTSQRPQQLFCQNCNEIVMTRVVKKIGDMTYFISGALCFCGCFCGCCLIPCLSNGCKDSIHFCTKCGFEFGVFNFFKL